jgi:hypothetical protein
VCFALDGFALLFKDLDLWRLTASVRTNKNPNSSSFGRKVLLFFIKNLMFDRFCHRILPIFFLNFPKNILKPSFLAAFNFSASLT